MKAQDIIIQLQNELPLNTGYFTDELSIYDMFRVDSTVTVVTTEDIKFKTGDYVNITGTNCIVPITSLTNLGCSGDRNVYEAITTIETDLTDIYNNTVTIVDADPPEYNGVFPLVASILYNKFSYSYPKTVINPVKKFGNLIENRTFGYNGRFKVIVLNSKTFTYELDYDTPKPEFSQGIIRTRPRISGAISRSEERRVGKECRL